MQQACALVAIIVLGGCAAREPQPSYATVARYLDSARAQITPPLGATTYELDRERLADQPGGENRSLAESLAQLPGVAIGPGGQVIVRGR